MQYSIPLMVTTQDGLPHSTKSVKNCDNIKDTNYELIKYNIGIYQVMEKNIKLKYIEHYCKE